jgi:uncharacterized small protein (DUF1192 family)
MAKTKEQLILEGKELGLNLNKKMSVYELEHRIKDRKAEIEKENGTEVKEKKSTTKRSGEY